MARLPDEGYGRIAELAAERQDETRREVERLRWLVGATLAMFNPNDAEPEVGVPMSERDWVIRCLTVETDGNPGWTIADLDAIVDEFEGSSNGQ